MQGKPQEMSPRWSEGKLRKFLGEITLLGQPFVKDDKQLVGDVLKRANAKILRFVRYEVGAGIEKKQEEFAAEVMAQVRGRLNPDRSRRINWNPARAGFLIMAPRRR